MHILLCAVLFSILVVSQETPLKLSDSNFIKELSTRGKLFTLFYAEWCGHCKKVAPIWEILAKNSLVTELVPVVKVDCGGDGKKTCELFGVQGYPTIKLVKDATGGKDSAIDYNGPRTEESLKAFVLLHSKLTIVKLTDEELKIFVHPTNMPHVVAFVSDKSKILEELKRIAPLQKQVFRFGYTYSKEAAELHGFEQGVVAMFRQSFLKTNLEPNVLSTSDTDRLEEFLLTNKHGLVGYRNPENENEFKLPNVVVHFDFDPKLHESRVRLVRNRIIPIAEIYRNMTFSFSSVEDYRTGLDEIVSVEKNGIVVIIYNERRQRFPYTGPISVNAVNGFKNILEGFVHDYVSGKVIQPFIKSEEVQKSESGHVKVVVGKTFEEVVYDEGKDVLIEMYAPWCGHCKSFEPTYEKLAEALKEEDKLAIVKMDATKNDAPESYAVSGFPTIFFAKIGQKDSPITYDGTREVSSMIEWLRKHVSQPLVISSKDAGEL